jgi:uncharacterized protein with PQ loop repeat
MNPVITTISMVAATVGIIAIVPQLAAMLRARSSAGQSPLGWSMGIATNGALAYVNLLGYHATVLGGGNLISLSGCLTALALVVRFRGPVEDAPGEETPVADLPTTEFAVLRDEVLDEHRRRTGERLVLQAA